jgi:hypothetical protein
MRLAGSTLVLDQRCEEHRPGIGALIVNAPMPRRCASNWRVDRQRTDAVYPKPNWGEEIDIMTIVTKTTMGTDQNKTSK